MPDLAHMVSGDTGGPTLLFLHGFMGSAGDWGGITSALDDQYRCVAIDLPGHGSSLGLSQQTYTTWGTARAVLDVLDALEVERATPVGYSMGGRLALYFALHHPERCSKLLLESASPGIEDTVAREARRIADEERAMRLETGEFEAFLKDWYGQPLFAPLARDRDLLARTIRARRRNDPSELARSLRGAGTGAMPPLWSRLADLQVSTLGVTGDLDERFVHIAHQMQILSPHVKNVSVPDAGHNVHLEARDAYLALLQDFVER